jgi:hypothetical protein
MDLSPYIPPSVALKASDSMQYYGAVGDYVGGVIGTIISALAFAGVIITLRNARKYEYRSKVYQVFSEMLRTHEDIVQSLSFNGRSGRDVFGEILEEFYQIHKILTDEGHFSSTQDPVGRVQVSFVIAYYGPHEKTARLLADLKLHSSALDAVRCVDRASAKFLENNFAKELRKRPLSNHPAEASWRSDVATVVALTKTENIPPRIRSLILRVLSAAGSRIAPPKVEELRDRLSLIGSRSHFPGHQNRLGHYFRNLYATYRYIDQASIPDEEKMRLGRVVRSKLSNYEQAVLALNALTPLGRSWRHGNNSLMRRYMPIRAVPEGFFGFDEAFVFHQTYSEVKFEWQELKSEVESQDHGLLSRWRRPKHVE